MATDGRIAWVTRVLGALSLLAVGSVHLQQYEKLYSAIPTIGTLFVLSFAGAVATSAGLLAPVERLLPRRLGGPAVVTLALVGIAQAVTQFIFLAISENRPLFGFQEPGYDPTAIFTVRAAEIATVVFLLAFLIARQLGGQRSRQPEGDASYRNRHNVTAA